MEEEGETEKGSGGCCRTPRGEEAGEEVGEGESQRKRSRSGGANPVDEPSPYHPHPPHAVHRRRRRGRTGRSKQPPTPPVLSAVFLLPLLRFISPSPLPLLCCRGSQRLGSSGRGEEGGLTESSEADDRGRSNSGDTRHNAFTLLTRLLRTLPSSLRGAARQRRPPAPLTRWAGTKRGCGAGEWADGGGRRGGV